MSQAVRQSELFTGNDWQVLYRAFTDINFNASDPPSINAALRNYIQTNYPENFNDWIESSEFVALIDLLSWLAGTLAFKSDLNAREAFLDTAEGRDSILRLARFISYNPSRNQCAQGLVKLVQVATNDDVYDAYGTNLNGVPILWDNADDADWYDRFTLILNSAMISTNQFGVPLKAYTVGNTLYQGYRLNNVIANANLAFTASVNGSSMAFEIVNSDFNDGGSVFEREPDGNNALNFLYLNDGNGYSSAQTGFFLLFKQGSLQQSLFNIPTPIENNVLAIPATGVNDSDVWVQSVDDYGNVTQSWSKVPAIFSQNITYNDYDPSIRYIFSVITQASDAISVRFSDGRFGAVPTGNLRVFYRTSNGLQYQIRPTDINRVSLVVPYYNRAGVQKNLTLTFSLQTAVANSTPAETTDQIKARAPSIYATQNRMVSGEDYNTFPLQSNLATKLKALNRVYSGHSRFIDLNDPTGNYQDVNVFSDDGTFFQQTYNLYTEVPISTNASPAEIVSVYMQPMLDQLEVSNYANNLMYQHRQSVTGVTWNASSSEAYFGATGYFNTINNFFQNGAALLFTTPTGATQWATIATLSATPTQAPPAGAAGPVQLSTVIPSGSTVTTLVPSFLSGLDANITSALINNITNNQGFTLWYDYSVASGSSATSWVLNPASPSATMFQVMTVNYVAGGTWTISANGTRYVFESAGNVQWYYDNRRTTDAQDGVVASDLVRIMKINEDLTDYIGSTLSGRALGVNYDLTLDRVYYNRDGSINPRRCTVTFADTLLSGYADRPDTWYRVVLDNPPGGDPIVARRYLFWQHDDTYGDIPFANMVYAFELESDRLNTAVPLNTVAFQLSADVSGAAYDYTFWTMTSTGWTFNRLGTYSYGRGRGPNVAGMWFEAGQPGFAPNSPDPIIFQWKHYAPTDHRIDPARTNINDLFVLTSEYDYQTRLWIANGCDLTDIPVPPTELELRLAFEQFEDYRMFSDQIVWRPGAYKFLFGAGAATPLQCQFKVVKVANTTLSDGEVQAQVIRTINNYFNVANWDFGETFYYTELAAYIHQQLATVVASVVLVPLSSDSVFGDAFEVQCMSNEVFISTAQVSDVVIISTNTSSNLKIR